MILLLNIKSTLVKSWNLQVLPYTMAALTKNARPSTSLQLSISAKALKNRDLLSKSDPQCILFQLEGRLVGKPEWKEKGRTEKIMNCLNPEWNTRLNIEYLFEERQQLRFELFDLDSSSASLSEHDFLGRFDCDLAEIVSAVDGVLTGNLTGLRGKCGTITISADELEDGSKEVVQFNCSGRNLDKKDFFGKSDPFLNIYRVRGDGNRQLAHRTETIKKTLNPDWKTFDVNSKLLCGGDQNAKIVIECFDYDFDGGSDRAATIPADLSEDSHDFIGNCETTLDRLLRRDDKELPLINAKKRAKKGDKYKNSGILHFNSVHVYKESSFLDFIHGGTQLDFAVAIDFTASNGPVHDPSSLHFINPSIPNQYEVALRACLEICQHYNHRKTFDAFGFGAKVGHNDRVSPVFNLNFRENPSVVGIQGVMESYRNSLNQVHLYGPTNFAPVIEVVARHAAVYPRDGSKYQVLLIITDGAISDMAKTKAAIVSASSLPLSIIIVGVGQEDFEAMDELDSDRTLLSHAGRVAFRDIVQFVPMKNFLPQYTQQNPHEYERSMGLLAKEVLAEIPAQLTGYMKMNKITPRSSDNPFPREPPAELPPPVAPIPHYPSTGNAPYSPSGGGMAQPQTFDGPTHTYPAQQPYPPQQTYGPPPAYPIQHQYPVQSSPYPAQNVYPTAAPPMVPQQYGQPPAYPYPPQQSPYPSQPQYIQPPSAYSKFQNSQQLGKPRSNSLPRGQTDAQSSKGKVTRRCSAMSSHVPAGYGRDPMIGFNSNLSQQGPIAAYLGHVPYTDRPNQTGCDSGYSGSSNPYQPIQQMHPSTHPNQDPQAVLYQQSAYNVNYQRGGQANPNDIQPTFVETKRDPNAPQAESLQQMSLNP